MENVPLRTVTAICNARVFDGNSIGEPTTVIIDGERIGHGDSVPANATETIDAHGAILLPGLIDCHIHLDGPDNLTQMAKNGVTTALDMATWPVEKLNSLRGRKHLTDIRGCGLAATAPGSVHSRIPSMPSDALVANATEAEKFVAARIADGADYIKVVADVPGPDQETLNALVEAAHRQDKLVIAHAVSTVATAMAQRAGVDFVTHAPLNAVMADEDVDQMKAEKRISIPTLIMMKGSAARFGLDFSNCIKTVGALHRAGIPILAGTDANIAEGVPANVAHGIAMHEELELLVDCGLSVVEALRSATCLPAEYFHLNDRGSVKPGLRADLVLVDAELANDISASRRIQRVWIQGKEVSLD